MRSESDISNLNYDRCNLFIKKITVYLYPTFTSKKIARDEDEC
jgi:hypothetical protein